MKIVLISIQYHSVARKNESQEPPIQVTTTRDRLTKFKVSLFPK